MSAEEERKATKLLGLRNEEKHDETQPGDDAEDGESGSPPEQPEVDEVDQRSVYVGQVDYECSPEELKAHFADAGPIKRVTILVNSHTGMSKGYAYIEFNEPESATKALELNDSELRGRQLKVREKRTNIPGVTKKKYVPPHMQPFMGGFMPFRGRGRGNVRGFSSRGRGRGRGGAVRSTPY
ncbi:MAG: uncharacterized protein KVP18_005027 [Porospora cf. gigantea A]|uniref:uncharacterized protein n=1 Tax=Porospora cf. gigantea A TaxID=2853593 RepID=UPI00355A175B|nr:MAG: hypothetical protein KVP18_005027 [Porospora cf. gigantea A]